LLLIVLLSLDVVPDPTARGWIPIGLPARPLPTTIVAGTPQAAESRLPKARTTSALSLIRQATADRPRRLAARVRRLLRQQASRNSQRQGKAEQWHLPRARACLPASVEREPALSYDRFEHVDEWKLV
jgi:hypothetical protein